MLNANAKWAFKQCHEVLHDPGKELLVFMLMDKDQKQSRNVPYSYPVAYALKGKSMTNKHLEYLIDKVRNELKTRNIPILCEAYDGQWHKFITEDKEGNSLTKLHGRENWNRVSGMSKDKCIEEIGSLSVVKQSTHEQIQNRIIDKGTIITVQDIVIEKGLRNELHLSSPKGKIQYIHSVHPISRSDLYTKVLINVQTEIKKNSIVMNEDKYMHDANGFKVKMSLCYMYVSIFECNNTAMKKIEPKRNCLIGLQKNKKNLMDVIHPQHETIAGKEADNVDLDEGEGVDAVNINQPLFTLDEYLKSNNSVILQNVLNELKNVNIQKWRDKTIDDLFPALLTNGEMLMEETTVKELNIICMELHCATDQNWSSSNMVKAKTINVIVKAFGLDSTVTVQR